LRSAALHFNDYSEPVLVTIAGPVVARLESFKARAAAKAELCDWFRDNLPENLAYYGTWSNREFNFYNNFPLSVYRWGIMPATASTKDVRTFLFRNEKDAMLFKLVWGFR
jgi:hypothetical protein